jgi:cation:H+ antiporter
VATGFAIPVFCASLALTLGSTLVFARELDRLSERLRVSEGLHGILTALGADAPEIATAVTALVASRESVGVGVVVGSNVFNLAALLGLSALVAGHVRIHRHGLLLNGGVALAITGITVALVLGSVGAVAAVLLLGAVFVPYATVLSFRPARIRGLTAAVPTLRFLALAVHEEVVDSRTGEHPARASRLDLAVLAASLGAIVLGSIGMVDSATDLGDRWGVSDVIVGTLVLAALTSLPNLVTAVRLALRGRGAATVSEAFNSNSLNVIAGIAIPSLFLTLGSAGGLGTFSMWWLLGMTTVAVVFAYMGHGVRRLEGGVVILLYVAFAVVVASR